MRLLRGKSTKAFWVGLVSVFLTVAMPLSALADTAGDLPGESQAGSQDIQANITRVLPEETLTPPPPPAPLLDAITFGEGVDAPAPHTAEPFDFEAARLEAEAAIAAMLIPQAVQIFPVVGGGSFSSSFGAPRSGGRVHLGNDIFAPKGTPVLAVADGVVVGASTEPGEKCCWVKIEHADGAQSVYLHLNNDTEGTDDGLALGVAEGIHKGAQVKAGTVIGYVGDSGNAEDTPPHLHFEYREHGTDSIDPHSLLAAAPVLESIHATPPILAAVETLPFTGHESMPVAVVASSFLLAGAVLVLASRREVVTITYISN